MAIALRGTATTTIGTSNIAAPSGLVTGDFLLAAGMSTGAMTTPAGWTQVRAFAVSTVNLWVGYLFWASGSSWTLTGSAITTCTAYSGVDPTTPLTAENGASGGGTSTASTPSITNDSGNWLVASFANGGFTYSGYSLSCVERAEVGNGINFDIAAADTNGAGPSGSQAITATMGGAIPNAAWIGSLKPAPISNPGQFFALM